MRWAGAVGALGILAACTAPPNSPAPGLPADDRSGYANYVTRSIAEGRLRLDRDARDVPFDGRDLARNFIKIALRQETVRGQRAGPIPLWRWEKPIRYRVIGGSATAQDRAEVDAFMERMARLSGRDIRPGEPANFEIYFLDAVERRIAARRQEALRTPRGAELADFLDRGSDWENPCRGTGQRGDGDTIEFVAVLIKAETVDRLRRACIEEEIAQGFGLINDDPTVEPSIFNDLNRFALLTDHDAELVRMLYHPLLRPGMTAETARPLLPRVLADLGYRDPLPTLRTGAGSV
ncbi:MAG: DUF2927 domain-containing protein [Pseudomonadota bacterium]